MRRAALCIVIVVVLAAGAAAWPAYDRPNALQSGVLQAGLAALALCFGLSAQRRRRANAPAPAGGKEAPWWVQPETLLAAWGVWTALSVLWAADAWLGGMGAGLALGNALWAMLVAHFLRGAPHRPLGGLWKSNWRLCVAFGGLAGGALALAALPAALRGQPEWWLATQGHKNVLGCYLLGALFLAVGGLATVRGMARGRRAATALLGASALAGSGMLLVSGSKGAFAGLGAGGAVFGLCFLQKRARWGAVAAGALLGAAALFAAPRVPGLPGALFRASDKTEQSTRLFHLESSRRMLARRPLAGWGAGNFMARFPEFMLPEAALLGWQTMLTIHPHNELALVATETGLAGLALFMLFAFGVVLRGWDACDAAADARTRWARAACLAGFAAMFAHAQMTVALGFWGPMAMWWTLAGLVMAAAPLAPKAPLPPRERGVVEGQDPLSQGERGGNGDVASGSSPEGRRENCRRPAQRGVLSRLFRPLAQASSLAAAAALLFAFALPGQAANGLMGKAMRIEAANGAPGEFLPLYSRVARLSRFPPQHLLALARTADALRGAGRGDEAIAAYERLESAAPGLGPTRLNLGRLRLHRYGETGRQGDLARALALLRAHARRRPESPEAQTYYARALLAESPGNAAKAGTRLLVAIQNPGIHAGPAAHDMLGECYALQGRFALAEEAIGKAAALWRQQWEDTGEESAARKLAETTIRWARAAAAAGRNAAALERLQEARGLLENHPDLQRQAEELAEALRQ